MWKLKVAEGSDPWLETTNGHAGRQNWEFDPDAGTQEERAQVERMRRDFKMNRFRNKQSGDLLMRMQLKKENSGTFSIPKAVTIEEEEDISDEAVTRTLRRAISFYSSIQAQDGHWPSESASPLFFSPPFVIALYITGSLNAILSPEHQKELIRYLYNHQNEDGGWGMHIEGHSSMFTSCLCYIALRLLGEDTDDGEDMAMARGRKWILDHGGAIGIPSWGKFWLAVLGVYEWNGCNPIPPELLLLPQFFPIHPGKFLCYSRSTYYPMSYLYAKRFTDLVKSLREELYTEPYHHINWNNARNNCAKEDLYYPHPFLQDMLWGFLHYFAEPILELWPFSSLRKRAMQKAMEHVHYEDKCSRYLCLGCVGKALSMLACWVEDPNSDAYRRHLARVPDYFWMAEDGLKIQSFGSQAWDASLAIQAIVASGLSEEYGLTLKKAHEFIKSSQIRENPEGNYSHMHRHISKGAWTFSTQDHGLQVSDCTAEGLRVSLILSEMPVDLVGESIGDELLYDVVNVILSLQSKNGGFPAWEPLRAYRWLEKLNSVEFFQDVMIETEYVECTDSALEALLLFKKFYPQHRKLEIEDSIQRAIQYIESIQEPDGSWYGNWGICYTFGTRFGVRALASCGKTYPNSAALQKACRFLLSKQLADGGWGESYLSCSNKVYTNLDGNRSNIVQTSWALLALMDAGQGEIDPEPIHRGIRRLINSQMDDGDFPELEITGVFFRNCTLHYSAYRNIYPIWALGEYRRRILLS